MTSQPPRPSRRVAIFVFDDAEVLDVGGPYEVFSVAGRRHGLEPFKVSLVAQGPGAVSLRNGFSINPHHTVESLPPPDLLVLPGGMGTRREMHNAAVLDCRHSLQSATVVSRRAANQARALFSA